MRDPSDASAPGRRVLGATTAAQLRGMLESVVGSQGTGNRAAVPGYRVAGKTGTVRKSTAGGYSEDRYVSVFAGMAPASSPRLVAVVVINEPNNGAYYGGEVAAPVFSRVIGGALRLLDVAPDDLDGAIRDETLPVHTADDGSDGGAA
jgi:cell division protein FtsI (penicillin-binding protein 3)